MASSAFARSCAVCTGTPAKRPSTSVVEMCFLESVLGQSVDTLSKGYRHRTCLAQSIIHDPDILVLDEPTDGLDPNQKHEIRGLIRSMGERKAIVFSTHILEEVEAVCSRAIIIDRGQIVANGTPQELKPKSEFAGAVLLIARGVHQAAVGRAALPPCPARARRPLSRKQTARFGRAFIPRTDSANGELARRSLAAATGWQVEELRTEEGRLDEVFRSITLPDTAKEDNDMNPLGQHHRPSPSANSAAISSSPVAYVFIVIFLLLTGFFTFTAAAFSSAARPIWTAPSSSGIRGFTCSWCRPSACGFGRRNGASARWNCY